MVDQSFNFEGGFTAPLEAAQSPSHHRCLSKVLGCLFKASKQPVVCGIGEIKTPHNILDLKAVFLVFKIIRKSISKSRSADFYGQFINGCLSEQTGRHPLSGDVCINLKNQGLDKCQGDSDSDKTHPREYQGSCRFRC